MSFCNAFYMFTNYELSFDAFSNHGKSVSDVNTRKFFIPPNFEQDDMFFLRKSFCSVFVICFCFFILSPYSILFCFKIFVKLCTNDAVLAHLK